MPLKLSHDGEKMFRQFLKNLPEYDIVSLAQTITNNLLDICTVEDAVKAIILHEKDLPTFFARKKITRPILLKFLHGMNTEICGTSDKITLSAKVLEFFHENHSKATQPQCSEDDMFAMATQFSIWFYEMLNKARLDNEGPSISETHFWDDCKMHLYMFSAEQQHSESVTDATSVVRLLSKVKEDHKLYFNVNLSSEGVKGCMDNHGLVRIKVCGTLHTETDCVGVFEQVFGLIRDPFMQNNWRIKFTKAVLRSQEVQTPPTLSNSACLALAYETDQ